MLYCIRYVNVTLYNGVYVRYTLMYSRGGHTIGMACYEIAPILIHSKSYNSIRLVVDFSLNHPFQRSSLNNSIILLVGSINLNFHFFLTMAGRTRKQLLLFYFKTSFLFFTEKHAIDLQIRHAKNSTRVHLFLIFGIFCCWNLDLLIDFRLDDGFARQFKA